MKYKLFDLMILLLAVQLSGQNLTPDSSNQAHPFQGRAVYEGYKKEPSNTDHQVSAAVSEQPFVGRYMADELGRTEGAVNRLLRFDSDQYDHLPDVFISEYRIRVTEESDRYLELMVKNGVNLHNYRIVVRLAALKNYFSLSQFNHLGLIHGYKLYALSGLPLGHHPSSHSRISLEKLISGVWTSVQVDLQDTLENAEVDKLGSNMFFYCSQSNLDEKAVEANFDAVFSAAVVDDFGAD